jgi:glycosyltransferase involved in cell wall biosynthesis
VKALHIINSLDTGGAERLASELLPALARLGLEVEVCVLGEDIGAFGRKLASSGIRVRAGSPGSLYSPARIVSLAKSIGESRPDILHVHLAPALHWTVAALRLSGSRIPLVTTEHTTKTRRMSRPWLKAVERLLYRRVASIACVSQASAEAVGSWLGLGAERFPVIPNGIDLGAFREAGAAADIAEFLAGRWGIVMAARFTEAKDQGTLIAAMKSLPENHALVLAGDGPTRPECENLATEAGLGARVLFTGARDDVPGILAACRVAALSSRWEGLPMFAIEAMAAGLPVAASDVPGLGSLVSGSGRLFPPGDAKACARAILDLAAEGKERSACIAAGRRRAAEFSIGSCAEAYAALYASILGMPGTDRLP